MNSLFLVGSGSFIGGILRYYLSTWTLQTFTTTRIPTGTLLVNIIGCLLIGLLASHSENQNVRLFLMTGLLGGFTTFSAFGYETITLMKNGSIAIALLYVSLSVVAGLTAVWLGMRFSS